MKNKLNSKKEFLEALKNAKPGDVLYIMWTGPCSSFPYEIVTEVKNGKIFTGHGSESPIKLNYKRKIFKTDSEDSWYDQKTGVSKFPAYYIAAITSETGDFTKPW